MKYLVSTIDNRPQRSCVARLQVFGWASSSRPGPLRVVCRLSVESSWQPLNTKAHAQHRLAHLPRASHCGNGPHHPTNRCYTGCRQEQLVAVLSTLPLKRGKDTSEKRAHGQLQTERHSRHMLFSRIATLLRVPYDFTLVLYLHLGHSCVALSRSMKSGGTGLI
jgi:hypothetical protein